MTAEEAMIATMTGRENEIPGGLVVMIPEATAGHVHQGEVLGIMIDLGTFTSTSVSNLACINGTPKSCFLNYLLLLW
jgi:hypothetical protein